MPTTKYVIECQQCKGSLTIALTVEEGDEPQRMEYEKHLVDLIETHRKWSEKMGHSHKLPDDGSVSDIVQDWITVVRPKPKPAK